MASLKTGPLAMKMGSRLREHACAPEAQNNVVGFVSIP